MHPMRKAKRRIQDRADIEQVLLEAEYLTLTINTAQSAAGNTAGSAPYAVPLSFGYKDGTIYFHCAREGRKLDLLRADPAVGFCTVVRNQLHGLDEEHACRATSTFASVIGAGRARIVEEAEKIEGLTAIMAHYSDRSYEFPAKVVAETCVVAVAVDWMDGKRNTR